jgi:diguanylate cyclase (GGDEF)-like protein
MTQAPNDSLPSPASLARSLGYAFVGGATVALVLTIIPNSADTNETGILSLVALAYAVGLLCMRAEDRLPSWATPAALALATILVTYAVEFFADPTQSVWSIFYVAGRPPGRPVPEPLARGRAGRARGCHYGLVMWGHEGALELWLGTVVRGRPRNRDGGVDAPARPAADRPAGRRGADRRAHGPAQQARPPGSRRARARAREARDRTVSIVVADIDRFQDFNESTAIPLRPRAQEVAAVLQESKRRIDVAARISGEEFALIAPDTDEHGAYVLADRLRREVRDAFAERGLTVSLGIASYPKHGATVEELLTGADRAVFAAKALGRDRTVIFNREISANLLGEQTRQAAVEEGHLAAVLVLAETLDMRDSGPHATLSSSVATRARSRRRWDERRGDRAHEPGRRAARHRQDRDPRLDSQEAGGARAARVGRDAQAPRSWARASSRAHTSTTSPAGCSRTTSARRAGLPVGLAGEQIPLQARILAVADAYEAMTNDRVYRPAMPESEARAELKRYAGTQFDPDVVEVFVNLLEREDRSGDLAGRASLEGTPMSAHKVAR